VRIIAAGYSMVAEGRAVADAGGLGRPCQRPTLGQYPIDQQLAPLHAEASVSVQLHPVSSLVLGG
jgi:hypothetical protein